MQYRGEDFVFYNDEHFTYAFSYNQNFGPTVYIELCIKIEDRENIVEWNHTPESNIVKFAKLLKEKGVPDHMLENLKISLSGLFYKCHNLKNINAFRNFDFSNVINFSEMFKFCGSLRPNVNENDFDILKVQIVQEKLKNFQADCTGMFDGAHNYPIPNWVNGRLFEIMWYGH